MTKKTILVEETQTNYYKKMKLSYNNKAIGILVIVGLIILGTAFFKTEYYGNHDEWFATVDAGYKLFRSTELGIVFMYPDQLFVEEIVTDRNEGQVYISTEPITFPQAWGGMLTPVEIRDVTDDGLTAKQYVDQLKEEYVDVTVKTGNEISPLFTGKQNIYQFTGLSKYWFDMKDPSFLKNTDGFLFLQIDGRVIQIQYFNYESESTFDMDILYRIARSVHSI